MAASPDIQNHQSGHAVPSADRPRRRRFERQPSLSDRHEALTVRSIALLHVVAEYKVTSLPQLARLTGASNESTRRQMRRLFDAGLVYLVPVPRAALAGMTDANDASLMFGSAPNIYTITTSGQRMLTRLDIHVDAYEPPMYGPRNSLFLAHELAVRDVRIWLELSARSCRGHSVDKWCDGGAAEIELKRSTMPKIVRPDAWFVYRLDKKVLIGLVEIDRATERLVCRGRWHGKLEAYGALYRGDILQSVTGYRNARILVTVPNEARRDRLASFIAESGPAELARRFWLVTTADLRAASLNSPVWQMPGECELQPLVPDLEVTKSSEPTDPEIEE